TNCPSPRPSLCIATCMLQNASFAANAARLILPAYLGYFCRIFATLARYFCLALSSAERYSLLPFLDISRNRSRSPPPAHSHLLVSPGRPRNPNSPIPRQPTSPFPQ